jgi:hypothetical protein
MALTARWRAAERGALRRLVAAAGPAGLVVGRDHAGALASVRLLRAEPTRLAVVGGSWLAGLLAFRALGLGAVLEVTTANPAWWSGFAEAAGATAQVAVVRSGEASPVPPNLTRPVVHLDDAGLGRPPGTAPWHGWVSVLPTLTAHNAHQAKDADAVLVQRVTDDEAELCASTLRLAGDVAAKLRHLHDDMVVLLVGSQPRWLWFATTPVEQQLLGVARRAEKRPAAAAPERHLVGSERAHS